MSGHALHRRCSAEAPTRGLLLACALALVLLCAATAAAQPVPQLRPAPPDLYLEVLGDEDDLRVQVQVRNGDGVDREDVRILATVHTRLVGRWRLRQAVEEGDVGNIVHPFVAELGTVPGPGSRSVELIQSSEEIGLARAEQEGVYPLRLQLLADGEVVDEILTSIVVLSAGVEVPLTASLLLPLSLPPARDAEGVVEDEAVLGALAEDGVLTTTAAALAATPDLNAVLGLDGHTLTDVNDLTDGFALREDGIVAIRSATSPPAERARTVLDQLAAAAAGTGVQALPLPYAAGDLVALVRNDLAGEAARQITDGRASVEWALGRSPAQGILWPPDVLDAPTLAMARDSGIETVILPESALVNGEEGNLSPPPVRQLVAPGGPLTAIVPDPYLERAISLGSGNGPAIDAQRVLAELASIYFEEPGSEGRGVVIAPPSGEHLPGDLLAALAAPLADAPFVRTSTLTRLQRDVALDERTVALDPDPQARTRELPSTYTSMLASARRALGSLGGVLEPDQPLPARFDRLLLQSASVHYRGEDLPRGRDILRTVIGTVDELYGAVEILDSPPVTLTAVQGELPVTVRSQADLPLRVRIGLRTARYEVEGGATREVELAPGSTEIITFPVRALAPGGTSPVEVVISDLDGVLALAQGTIVVRSTAFSVVGLIVTIGAAVFLLLWALREVARRRQRARPRPPPDGRPAEVEEHTGARLGGARPPA